MAGTTYANFNKDTEGLEVAKAFAASVKGKTILVIGVNRGGIGFTTAQAFASQNPAHLILAGRTPSKLQECLREMQENYPDVDYRTLELDLASQKNIRASAANLLSWDDISVIDIVVNNAAIMNLPERQIDEAGIERTFATNQVGHYLFTCSIMPKLLEAAKVSPKGATRVINVSSLSPIVTNMRWSDMNFEKVNKTLPEGEQPTYRQLKAFGVVDPEEQSYTPIEAYNQSKAANVLFSIALSNRLYEKHGILSFACHPGIIETELSRYASEETRASIREMGNAGVFQYKSLAAGAATTVTVALDPKLGMPISKTDEGKENYGVYFSDCQINDGATRSSTSSAGADRLWKYTEQLVKEKFAW